MSRRDFVLKNFHRIGVGNSRRLIKYAYAILLSNFLRQNRDKPKFNERVQMYDYIIDKFSLSKEKLQYFEFGVFKGESIKYLNGVICICTKCE